MSPNNWFAEYNFGRQAPFVGTRRATSAVLALCALVAIATPIGLRAQRVEPPSDSTARRFDGGSEIDSLIRFALATSPVIKAASGRLDAARHRIGPAAAWPDPMLIAGIVNQPLGKEAARLSAHGTPTAASGPDPMTMRMVGVTQTIPYPGKLRLERGIAERELDAASASVDVARRQVVRDLKAAYYEIAFLDHALAVIENSRNVLERMIRTTEARYGVGQSSQQDVLKARIDAARLAESASSLLEQRRAALARLNAILNRPSDTPLERADVPRAIERAAVGDSTREARFASAAFGARVGDSPLPTLGELQAAAIRNDPELREHEAMIAAQTARLELSRKSTLPDVDLSVQYGQRGGGLPDMLTATVSVPIPLQKRRRQDAKISEASSTLSSLHAEHEAKVNALRSEIARLVSELERERTQLALYRRAILPQARAAVTTSAASYQVGKAELPTVLDSQSTLFTYETDYYRALSDFAINLAELERVIGKEILQ